MMAAVDELGVGVVALLDRAVLLLLLLLPLLPLFAAGAAASPVERERPGDSVGSYARSYAGTSFGFACSASS